MIARDYMMEQSEPNSRAQFSVEASQPTQHLTTAGSKAENLRSSPEVEPVENMSLASSMDTQMGNAPESHSALPIGGTQSIQQPKVQTAFIHKLYNMLEDNNIQHLISWSPSNESFVVAPTGEFSKVLSQYFKHTNISSFVRQLNMYGFHKVNDVFHTGSPDSTLWEFKHGNGSFKRGDLVGLREIKRRASRHTPLHRDSFSGTKSAAVSTPGTPNEQPIDANDARMMVIEQTLLEVNTRLARTEESTTYLAGRCQLALDGLTRCHQWTSDLAQFVSQILPQDAPALRDLRSLQKEIERHTQLLEEPQDILRERQQYSSGMDNSGPPLSPRQRPVEDDSRRSSLSGQLRTSYFRQPAPPHFGNPTRRIGAAPGSPNALRPQQTSTQLSQHPLSSFQTSPGHLSRRHTSADIRQHGWQASSPFSGIGQTPHWPPSPSKGPSDYRDLNYDIHQHPRPSLFAPHATPPTNEPSNCNDVGWSIGGSKYQQSRDLGHTVPQTRRSSLASSSVHALLNPPDYLNEREGVSDGEPDDRKRKRIV